MDEFFISHKLFIIIAKYYPPALLGARAIQMEHIINAFLNYYEININIITVGKTKNEIEINKRFSIHTIKHQFKNTM